AATRCLEEARAQLSRCDNAVEDAPDPLGDCAVLVGTRPVGDTCVDFDCEASAFCDLSGTCVALAQKGESCAAAQCAEGLVCLSDQTCELPLDLDGVCEVNSQCQSLECTDGYC